MAKGQSLQDPFLNALRKERVPVSIYLVNGIKLQGQIDSFDQFVVLLKNSVSQMVYKHAISTVVPARNVRLPTARKAMTAPRRPPPSNVPRHGKPLSVRAPTHGERAVLVRLGLGAPVDPEDLQEFTQLARSAGAMPVATRHRAARAPRPALLPRQRQGRGSARRSRRPQAADVMLFDHALSPEPGAQPREAHRAPRARPHRPDPRHLRAARAQLRRQARSRARAAQAHRQPPGARLDAPGAPEGRHRLARSRRNAARDRPPPARASACACSPSAWRRSRSSARPAAQRARRDSGARRSRWSATPTPASPRCSAR